MQSTNYKLTQNDVQYWWVIPLLTDRELVGQVTAVHEHWFKIRSLIQGLPTDSGDSASVFFAPRRLNPGVDVKEYDYIGFYWYEPGTRGRNRDGLGDPIAANARKLTTPQAQGLKNALLETLQVELQTQLEELNREYELHIARAKKVAEKVRQERTNHFHQILQDREERDAEWQKLKKEEKRIEEHYKKKIKPIEHILPLRKGPVQKRREPLDFETIGKQWHMNLNKAGLNLPEDVSCSFLISALAACLSGSLVLLSGSVGTGKTRTIRTAAQLLDGGAEVVPVRPSWLDSSDLLGFFDPLRNLYSPSPFANGLIKAGEYADRFFFLTLDELNLARIEDYGADLLSLLEYSKTNGGRRAGVQLYAQDIYKRLLREYRLLKDEKDQLNSENKRLSLDKELRMGELAQSLRAYPGTVDVPHNLVLMGTLNADETTYDLSPKVIDRSYVINFPTADLSMVSDKPESYHHLPLSLDALRQSCAKHRLSKRAQELWQRVVEWNNKFLKDLGVPLGYRTRRDYIEFITVAHLMGIEEDRAFQYFVFTKLLPRIKFHKNGNREILLRSWLESVGPYLSDSAQRVESWLTEQAEDTHRPLVSYWR